MLPVQKEVFIDFSDPRVVREAQNETDALKNNFVRSRREANKNGLLYGVLNFVLLGLLKKLFEEGGPI